MSAQLAYLPCALGASERQALLDRYVQQGAAEKAVRFLHEAEAQGYRVSDLQGNPIRSEDFVDQSGADFILTTPTTDDDAGFAYKVHVSNRADGVAKVDLSVTRPGERKVMARRAFSLDYHEDAVAVRLRMAQTEKSLETQLRMLAGEHHASFWQRAGRQLKSVFGENSAQAGVLSTGVRVALGFAGVSILLFALDGVAEHYGVTGARAGRYVILVGLAIAATTYYFSFDATQDSGPIPVGR